MSGQQLVNQSWTAEVGTPISDLEWSATISDGQGYIYTTGHNVVSFDEVELLLVKKDRLGTTIWEQTFSFGTGTKSYGIDLQLVNNKLYVIGATYNPSNGNHDYLLLTYNTSGTLIWDYTYNAPANGDDIPSSLVVLTNGYIYITGVSYDPVSDYDYLTICVAPSGALLWDVRYDHNNLKDGAAVVKYVSGSGVVVTGASEALTDQWGYASVMYDVATGSQLYEKRKSSGIVGLDAPLDFAVDNAGFIYLTGSANPSGGDNDIYTLKMDDELEVIWEQYHDGYGNDDEGRSITIDAAGNVYVCGYFAKASGANYMLIKYDTAGTVEWQRERSSVDADKDCICDHLTEDNSGNLVLTGREKSSATTEVKTLAYDPDGQLLWEKIRTPSGPVNAYPTELTKTTDGVLVTAQNNNQGTGTYELIKYKTYDYTVSYDSDSLGNATNVDREIIIRFNPQVIDTAFADDPNMIFGAVGEIITNDSLISEMDQVLGSGSGTRVEDWVMYKVFPWLTTENRFLSVEGKQKLIPSLWSTYILRLEGNVDEPNAVNSLEAVGSISILYACLNSVLEFHSVTSANDEYYDDQLGLYDATAGINIGPAWAEVTGSSEVKVGVVDTGIRFTHEDMGFGGSDLGGLAGTVVGGGFYLTAGGNQTPFTDSDAANDQAFAHGTRVASIIGALRNNTESGNTAATGISGIAGGDIDNESRGVDLYALKVADAGPTSDNLVIANAMNGVLFAITGAQELGQGTIAPIVDVLNCSFGDNDVNVNGIPIWTEILETAFISETTTIISRGNFGGNIPVYPATINEGKWHISVGASGNNGELVEDSDDQNPGTFGEPYSANFGSGMDIIAPGVNNLIVTIGTQEEGVIGGLWECPNSDFTENINYSCFNGSSSSAAHVSGVAALLFEKSNQYGIRLLPEDTETLIEYGATDVLSAGEDEKSGWGRLNAGESVGLISTDQKVLHVKAIPELDENAICETCSIELSRPYDAGGFTFLEGANYGVKVNKYTANVSLDISGSGAEFVDLGSTFKQPVWELNSRSNLWDGEDNVAAIMITPENAIFWKDPPVITNNNILTGTLVGYIYEITGGPGNPPNITIPYVENNEYEMWFSILVSDPTGLLQNEELIITNTAESKPSDYSLLLSPNPAQDILNIRLNSYQTMEWTLDLVDMNGKTIKNIYDGSLPEGLNDFQLITADISPGMYVIVGKSTKGLVLDKFIKL
jgi:hypothetical protein